MATLVYPDKGTAEFYTDIIDNDECVRVVLLGKTGSGKSSLGNTLLGHSAFHVARGMCSGTDRCQYGKASDRLPGKSLQVTDTPGVCDTHRSESDVLKEVGKSLVVSAPGPHVILMVLRCDRRFTREEHDAYMTLKCLFGEDICQNMIVVFVGFDCLGSTVEERRERFDKEMRNPPPLLKTVLNDANGRYYGLDNLAAPEEREVYAHTLLEMIQDLVSANGGRYFNSELCHDVTEYLHTNALHKMTSGDDITLPEAVSMTKQDVLEEKASPDFFRRLMDIVGNKVLPVLKRVLGDAIAIGATAVSTYCSVM